VPSRARALVVVLTGASFLFACASASPTSTKRKRTPVEPGDDFFADDVPSLEEGLMPTNNEDSGAFGASSRPAVVGPRDGGAADANGGDAGPVVKEYCAGALAPGDLRIEELLIASRAGSLDDGEWIEIRSARTCWLKVKGLTIESPRGTFSPNRATIAEDFELAPRGSFVVADSADPAKNHGLPGKVFAWSASDVLKNDGDTASLKLGDTVIDSLTYPAFTNLEPGRTLAFPEDCAPAARGDWARWSLSFDAWAPGQKGTPNATNSDVACY
jgi:hypothetical protein